MSAKAFSTPPHTPTIPLRPYEVNVPQADLDDLQVRLALPARHAATWDNTTGPAHLGVRRDWLQQAVERWKTFDWRATEKEINSFPNFIGSVAFEGIKYEIQFLALFSKRKDAVPLMLNHGWPGSILEFVPTLLHVSKTYTPANLPYHVIVPSLVGYGFSSMPPLDRPFGARECAGAFDALMTGLGLGIGSPRGGYIAQGGDIGSFVSRQLATFDGCIGIHLNFFPMIIPTQDKDIMGALDDTDRKALERAALWDRWGRGYFYEHLSKPATIGAVLESSPVAVLAW
jgi:microsomal epoxide hydrolase